jgi:monovalent cation:H+ antiporter-2, CPA2 family
VGRRVTDAGLIADLAIALLGALIGALIAARLGQSVILGYIVAGIAIGPFTPGFVGDAQTVEALAEIGVILLMFAIGVQFSLRDLVESGKVALVGSTAQVLITIVIGYLVGVALGWQPLEALFFGAVISNSSSTILSKVLGERGELDSPQGKLSLAWSSLQDLGTVVLIVVLSALATEGESLLPGLAWEVGKAGLFLALLIPVGLRVLPWFFGRVAGLRNREVFVLAVGTVALGLAYSASFFGLSLALGAFVAGVVVGESDLSHQILGDVLPLRDIFAGLFFVSVGMLVDPRFVVAHLPLMLVTLALIVPVKWVLCAGLAAVLGTPTRTAVLVGAALAQSAEFSFLLAHVGNDLGVVSPTVFSLMLSGAAASIVLAPTVYGGARPLSQALADRWPGFGSSAARAIAAPSPDLRGHAVICGYGRVGEVLGAVLHDRAPFVVIEEDPRIVTRLRDQSIPVIQGNAALPAVLDRAELSEARILVVAIPDPVAVRQVVDRAQAVAPGLDIIVRTHSESERQFLVSRRVSEVVLGELELALELTRHTLQGFGLAPQEIESIVQATRQHGRVTPPAHPLGSEPAGSPRTEPIHEIEPQQRAIAEVRQGLDSRLGFAREPLPPHERGDQVDIERP